MPRHARIVAAGFPMHAIPRGIDRTAIFFAEGDYGVFRPSCQRYIELNPVSASAVRTPEDDPWSSDHCNALGVADPVIAPNPLYLDLADADEGRRSRYRGLFADAIPQDMLTALRDATNGGFVLGSQRFQKQVAKMVGRRT